MGNICAFFGHREIYHDLQIPMEAAIIEAIDQGYDTFWCGGYGAFDLCAAGTVHRLKKQYPQIQSVLILAYFPKHPLLEIYDYSIFPEGLEMGPTRFAINQRNRWIIQNCHSSICYVNHAYGGAYAAYQKLVRQNKVLRNLGTLTL